MQISSNFNPLDYGIRSDQIFYSDIHCVLGVTRYGNSSFLLVATATECVGSIFDHPIFEIREVELLPLEPENVQGSACEYAHQLSLVILTQLLRTGFFFALGYDLTNSYPRNKSLEDPFSSPFCWNVDYCKPFLSQVNGTWLTPVIRGFVASVRVSLDSGIELSLVSRKAQSTIKCGTLSGLRENGDVGYFVESEFLCRARGVDFSFLQVRGTAPVSWKLTESGLQLTRLSEDTSFLFIKHISRLLAQYQKLLFLNLLCADTKDEKAICDCLHSTLSQHMDQLQGKVAYHYFSFSADGQQQVIASLGKVTSQLLAMKYFAWSKGQVLVYQQGVPRINCFDCISRTNVVMSNISRVVLLVQLKSLGVGDDIPVDLYREFNNLWLRNCEALRTTQRKDFDAAVYLHSDDPARLVVKVCSWNLGGQRPPIEADLTEWLFKDYPYPHILVVGLQEIVKLNAKHTLNLSSNQDTVQAWTQLILTVLNHHQTMHSYVHIATQDLVGCYIVLFISHKLTPHLSSIETDSVKVGFGNRLGNKGAVGIRFTVMGLNFCFLNCHLESGMDQWELRTNQLSDILTQSFQKSGKAVLAHDAVYVFGDLNYRIGMDREQVMTCLDTINYEALRQADQLGVLRRNGNQILGYFSEAEIKFFPTYKYNWKENLYNSKRVPAWPDRVLYRGAGIEPMIYRRSEIAYSDHRPVSFTSSMQFPRPGNNARKWERRKETGPHSARSVS